MTQLDRDLLNAKVSLCRLICEKYEYSKDLSKTDHFLVFALCEDPDVKDVMKKDKFPWVKST